jgi:hypothetical protein
VAFGHPWCSAVQCTLGKVVFLLDFFGYFFKGAQFQVPYGLLIPYPPRTATLDKWKWSFKPLEMFWFLASFDPSWEILQVLEKKITKKTIIHLEWSETESIYFFII